MITINSGIIKINPHEEGKIIKEYIEPSVKYHECPYCGSPDVVRNGTYDRNVVYICGKRLATKRLKMQRYLCKNCGKTKTGYPAFIIAGREYSVSTMFYVCGCIKGRRKLSEDTGIPMSQIRKLRQDFRGVKKRIKSLLPEPVEMELCELIRNYEEKYLRKPFEAYQRDMYLTPHIRSGYL